MHPKNWTGGNGGVLKDSPLDICSTGKELQTIKFERAWAPTHEAPLATTFLAKSNVSADYGELIDGFGYYTGICTVTEGSKNMNCRHSPIIMIGMHRSGTSMLIRSLEAVHSIPSFGTQI